MDGKRPFTSIAGATQETSEPTSLIATLTSTTDSTEQTTVSAKPTREPSSSSISTAKKLLHKRATSTTNSPIPSRETSPVRPQLKAASASARATGPSRSRKNSVQEISPSRPASTNPPSAAATQRALSAQSIPTLHPVAPEPLIRSPIPLLPSLAAEIKDSPRWPISPRLRSPPPINTKQSSFSSRKPDQDVPAINVQRTPSSGEQEVTQAIVESEAEDSLSLPGMRTPARGASVSTLETVQEISQPNTPALGLDDVLEKGESGSTRFLTEKDNIMDTSFGKTLRANSSQAATNESGSDSGGKGEIKMRSNSAAPVVPIRATAPTIKSNSVSAAAGRSKPAGEGSTRNMTVETETVSSVPQVAVGVGGAGNNGSIRTKPSSETIRPKKEKKKTTRKTPSVASGVVSSKADIFEAKVASAVDEANSSDSEETFVYESNPPDNSDRPRRFHSRTPSATSMASQIDQRNGVRSIMDTGHSVAMKKSMKFANSYNSNGPEAAPGEDDGKGTARSNMGTGRGTTHHHHFGRWGRNGGNGHPSLFDNESPFPNAAKSKLASNGPRHSSRPTSPKIANQRLVAGGKKSSPISSGYDFEDGADDERTPLISTVRSGRSGRTRRQAGSSLRQLEHQAARHNRSFLARFAGCLLLSFMIILVISGAIGFMFATTQPLVDVKVLALKNVLASEQDVILDMKVTARNPNLVAVTIDAADMVVFAKSQYAGTDSEWYSQPSEGFVSRSWRAHRRDDDPLDPPLGDDPSTKPNLEIGRIYEFDSPLSFEGSPFHHAASTSLGQIRISHPGSKTVPAGSERWGRVVQHEFDLIVRGTLKYTLPLSQKIRSISVEGRITVKPNAADQDPDSVHLIPNVTDGIDNV